MTIYVRSEELVSRCVECDLAEPESLASLGGSAPGVVDGILSNKHEQFHTKSINSLLLRKKYDAMLHLGSRVRPPVACAHAIVESS